jgi:hypothetical protein
LPPDLGKEQNLNQLPPDLGKELNLYHLPPASAGGLRRIRRFFGFSQIC